MKRRTARTIAIKHALRDTFHSGNAIASSAGFILTNDRDFNILKDVGFPKMDIKNIEEFGELLANSN
jgi:hypothetical protein